MRIAIVTPQHAAANTGNAMTAARWKQRLRELRHQVAIIGTQSEVPDCDVLIALHAGHSANAILKFHKQRPNTPIVLGTVGTDLYTSIRTNARAKECLKLASRLVVLQPEAIQELPQRYHSKCSVVYQSTTLPTSRPKPLNSRFEVCVIGHLRPVKDPFRAAMAVRKLPAESKLQVVHLGSALSDSMRKRAEKETKENPHYEWLGELSHKHAMKRLLRCRALVHSSKTEGGANVITEAIMSGVPVLSSRIPGSIGLLGKDYPGYFETGNTAELRELLLRIEREPQFLASLHKAVKRQQPLFKPANERAAWKEILDLVSTDKRTPNSKTKRRRKPQNAKPKQTAKVTAAAVKAELRKHIDPVKAAFFPRFFKAGKGEYAEGDKFIGVTVPNQRKVAKKFRDLPEAEIRKLLNDPVHEHRLTGVLILVGQYQNAKRDEARQQEIVDFYLDHLDRVNNWDLVDSSAHKILGDWLIERDRALLYELAESEHLWRERVSVIACLPLIKNGDFEDILNLAEHFLDHEHDLMHKAVGWMLREIGKIDEAPLHRFLRQHCPVMPRTMLRYAIEKLPESQRQAYLRGAT